MKNIVTIIVALALGVLGCAEQPNIEVTAQHEGSPTYYDFTSRDDIEARADLADCGGEDPDETLCNGTLEGAVRLLDAIDKHCDGHTNGACTHDDDDPTVTTSAPLRAACESNGTDVMCVETNRTLISFIDERQNTACSNTWECSCVYGYHDEGWQSRYCSLLVWPPYSSFPIWIFYTQERRNDACCWPDP